MDVLGFPLEAFFLGDYCLAPARSPWVWIAVLTAAFSFWRITAVGSRLHHKSVGIPSFQDQLGPKAESAETEVPQDPPSDLTPAKTELEELTAFVRDDGGRKGIKFTAYYCEYDDDVRNEEEDDGRNEAEDVVGGTREDINGHVQGVWPFDVRVTMMQLPAVRTDDLGWYRCQDITALNGSVVRLWDGGRRRSHR